MRIPIHPNLNGLTIKLAVFCCIAFTSNVKGWSYSPPAFTIQSIVANDSSCVGINGSINLTITPQGNYSFLWSTGQTSEDLTQLASGIYQVTVYDANQNSMVEIFTIEDVMWQPVIKGIPTHTTCGENNGAIDVTVSPSVGYVYGWSSGATTQDLTDLDAGTYSLTVTDENGCSSSRDFSVYNSYPLHVEILPLEPPNGDESKCTLKINKPLALIDHIAWSPLSIMTCQDSMCTEQTFPSIAGAQVEVRVVDQEGCLASDQLVTRAEDIATYSVYVPNVFSPDGSGYNDKFTIYSDEGIADVESLEIYDRSGRKVWENAHFPLTSCIMAGMVLFKTSL